MKYAFGSDSHMLIASTCLGMYEVYEYGNALFHHKGVRIELVCITGEGPGGLVYVAMLSLRLLASGFLSIAVLDDQIRRQWDTEVVE